MKSITQISDEIFNSQPHEGDKPVKEIESVTVRFAGDSGDGMQLTGTQFTSNTAFVGNDMSTFPDFPAEIRAPAGTVAGVSGFQIHFSSSDVHTPGDSPEVLIAMNPAALKANLKDVVRSGVIVVNSDAFTESNLSKVGYETSPLEDDTLKAFRVVSVPISTLTKEALADIDMKDKDKERSKNMFALGLVYWMFDRPINKTIDWVNNKFKKNEEVAKANILALKAGYNFGNTSELLPVHFHVTKADMPKGTYRNITGNQALSWGIVAAAQLSGQHVFLGSYPITPASDILHELAKDKNYGVSTFQAEDEIAAMAATIGAAYAGQLAVTTTSGPGFALKSEALNLAVMAELPLVVVNVQRGGPSTGLPTKVEQSDLMQAMYGRNGESPLVVLAPKTPVDCFYKAIEAFKLAVKYMTPVVLLSDGYLANGSQQWKLPKEEDLQPIKVHYHTSTENPLPYERDENLARPWILPGTPGLEHRIGGLEKEHLTGNVSYDGENHEYMTRLRQEKIDKVKETIGPITVEGSGKSKSLLVGWGSTYGVLVDARETLAEEGIEIDQIHIAYLNPFPANLGEVLSRYENIFVAELNLGQLASLLSAEFAVEVHKINKVKGKPLFVTEVIEDIKNKLK